MIKTAVILAGGEGSRLRPLTNDLPKPLAPVSGKPILQWVIEWLKSEGIKNLVIGVAYKKEKIYEFMKKNDNFGLNVNISEHTVDGGTSQGFRLAISRFIKDDIFLAMNGDELTNLKLKNIVGLHEKTNPLVTMALAPFHCKFSVVRFEGERITGFEYGKKLENIPISMGVYIFNKKILDLIPETGSIENSVFSKLATEKEMVPYMLSSGEEWISVNALKDIKEAEKKLSDWGRL